MTTVTETSFAGIQKLGRALMPPIAVGALERESSEAVRALVASTWPGLAAHHGWIGEQR